MSDPKCAEMLFRAAERDLLTLRGMAAGVPDESFGFHVQQAAEKAFKAWLCLLGETYPLTRNLEALVGLLAAQGITTPPFRALIPYTPYAVEFHTRSSSATRVSARMPVRSTGKRRSSSSKRCSRGCGRRSRHRTGHERDPCSARFRRFGHRAQGAA